MSKPLVLVTAPVKTRSGYGNHARDICTALIDSDKYEVLINGCRWGNTPLTALEKGNPQHDKIAQRLLTNPKLPKQPDLHIHIVIPNEFQPVGKKNIGITAGIETTIPIPQWLDGANKMDKVLFTSKFTEEVFKNAEFEDKNKQLMKFTKPSMALFEGFDPEVYKETNVFSEDVKSAFDKIDSNWNFLFVGHWLSGKLGQDRKDTGMLVKVFLESFKNQKNPPGLILKSSGADFSILDREELLGKINDIKKSVNGVLPPIYLIHGDFTDSQMNELYNHSKVKAHVTFTHGEGFGRPLLEATQSGKPVIAPDWSGQVDFLDKNYAVLLQGGLTQVPDGAFNEQVFFKSPENKWFTINYNVASQVLKDVHKNYTKYLVKSKQLQVLTSQKFNLNKMRELLVREVDEVLKDVPQEVKLKLPKLKKV
jgi:glycosyltransferase involved in cell wall biosynthesis